MNNWRYASALPSKEWRGHMSIPREIQLRTCSDGLRLTQAPITELNQLRRPILSLQDITIKPDMNVLSAVSAAKMEIIAEFEIGTAIEFGFKVRKSSSSNQETVIGLEVAVSSSAPALKLERKVDLRLYRLKVTFQFH
ncbi:GH32 C-terminal domain-containing protein [Paenibacillus sp. Z3-2]